MRHPVFRYTTVLVASALLAGRVVMAAPSAAEANGAAPPVDLLSHHLQAQTAAAAAMELEANNHPPPEPASWHTTNPSGEEKVRFYLPYVQALVDKAKDYYTRFPNGKIATQARLMDFQLSELMLQWGQTNEFARFQSAGNLLLRDPVMNEHDHFVILFKMAGQSPPAEAKKLYQQILDGKAPDDMKSVCTEKLVALKNLDRVGKRLDLQFTAADGRNVDLAQLKGKVVLVDFWATWCPACVMEMPNVKKVYDQFHPRGFEVVGISLDESKEKMQDFTSGHSMPWPQYFDGLHWENKLARQFGIFSIPAMWLVDKKGDLRSLDAHEDLDGQVQKLLLE